MKKQPINKSFIVAILSLVAVFILTSIILMIILFFMFMETESSRKANSYIKSNTELVNEIGEIKSYNITNRSNGTSRDKITFEYIIKGENKTVTAYVELEFEPHGKWEVTQFRYGR